MNPAAAESGVSCDKVVSDAELQSLDSLSVTKLANSVRLDEKVEFVSKSRQLMNGDPARDRFSASKLLHACCAFDAVECAAALLDGEVGTVPLVNERDSLTGLSALHSASEAHACYCIKLLLKRRARTDLRSRDGRAQLPLELSLNSTRMEVTWNPDDYSVEDLVVLLSEKDLTAVKLLSEKTKEIGEVALASAIGGKIVALAALLIVAADKVNEAILCANGADKGSTKENATVYECFIREAISMRSDMFAKKAGACTLSEAELEQKRKLLLCEIELLQLFGATALRTGPSTEKKLPPLVRAIQAGDEAVVKLLLETNDVNDADADGNSALHWCIKASWSSTSQQLKILRLLLKYGIRVNRKDKLERTAFHIAASKGNSKALQALLLEDPDGINYKTIMKETPIFFAARNDHIDCVEKLLYWGANSEVLNLRKERPIDLAKSQDMRFMLSPTNTNFIRSACSVQQMRAANFQCDDETLSMTEEEDGSMDRNCLGAKAEVCKYFEGPGGCVRGSKCAYAHGQEELKKMNQGMHITHCPATVEFRRKIFVGGLLPSLDSDALRQFFEERFGSVEYANIMKVQVGNEMHSRGFGFVTFKNEVSANEAVKVQHVTIMGKQAEIKSATRKCFLLDKPQKASVQDVQEHYGKCLPKMEALHPGEEMPRSEAAEYTKNKQTPWMDTLLSSIPKSPSCEVESHQGLCLVTQKGPPWLRAFRKWLPSFLKEMTKNMNGAKYPLSSLKADFKAACGQELDHASLGYLKLSEFIQEFSDLCRVEFMQRGGTGAFNHMVLFPRGPRTSHPPLRSPPSNSPFCDKSAAETDAFKCMKDLHPSSLENLNISSENNQMLDLPKDSPQKNSELEDTSIIHPRFLKFLQPYKFQPQARESIGFGNQLSHSVLQCHAEMTNKSSFFLREFDFHHAYRKCIEQGKCFWCRQRNLLWANFPCGHLLWCTDCKIKAAHAAIGSEHKCVVCDMKVDRFILISSGARIQPWHGNFHSHMEILPPNTFRTELVV